MESKDCRCFNLGKFYLIDYRIAVQKLLVQGGLEHEN
jgi:hypothetical protein